MKQVRDTLFIAAILLFSSFVYATSGLLFNITESGAPASVDVILCLNGKGPLSCQNYPVSAQNLAISTTARHQYPSAGIKVLTPGYKATGCAPYPNGYCLFAVNSQMPTTILLKTTPSYYTLGGTISGLIGSVSLQNNGSDTFTQSSDGGFTFATPVAQGASYNVTVSTQPATQTCTVNNGTGTIGGANVTNVDVSCVTNTTTLSVSATGTIPVGSGTGSITVTNTGSTYAATNVSVTLPSGWTDVTQDASNCTFIPYNNGTCTIQFTATTPYIAQGNIQVTGDNISNPPTTALAFTVGGYLVWEVTNANTVQVIDSVNLAPYPPNGIIWDPLKAVNRRISSKFN